VAQAASRNKVLARDLQSAERVLQSDAAREASLRSTLAALKKQKPPPAPRQQSYGSVALPTVQTTTGASGMP